MSAGPTVRRPLPSTRTVDPQLSDRLMWPHSLGKRILPLPCGRRVQDPSRHPAAAPWLGAAGLSLQQDPLERAAHPLQERGGLLQGAVHHTRVRFASPLPSRAAAAAHDPGKLGMAVLLAGSGPPWHVRRTRSGAGGLRVFAQPVSTARVCSLLWPTTNKELLRTHCIVYYLAKRPQTLLRVLR